MSSPHNRVFRLPWLSVYTPVSHHIVSLLTLGWLFRLFFSCNYRFSIRPQEKYEHYNILMNPNRWLSLSQLQSAWSICMKISKGFPRKRGFGKWITRKTTQESGLYSSNGSKIYPPAFVSFVNMEEILIFDYQMWDSCFSPRAIALAVVETCMLLQVET